MLVNYLWSKYTKEYSTNQLIGRGKSNSQNLIRLKDKVFKLKLNDMHSSLFSIFDGSMSEFDKKYSLFESNFRKLLISELSGKIVTIRDESELNNLGNELPRVIYSMHYSEIIHKFTKQNKIYYITLV